LRAGSTGTSSSEWINANEYVNFSLVGKATNSISIQVHWVDARDDTSYIDTGLDLTSTWNETNPVDLSSILGSDWEGSIKELWLEFDGTNFETDIRIGWIKLTE